MKQRIIFVLQASLLASVLLALMNESLAKCEESEERDYDIGYRRGKGEGCGHGQGDDYEYKYDRGPDIGKSTRSGEEDDNWETPKSRIDVKCTPSVLKGCCNSNVVTFGRREFRDLCTKRIVESCCSPKKREMMRKGTSLVDLTTCAIDLMKQMNEFKMTIPKSCCELEDLDIKCEKEQG